jgi:membrane-associated PAP2 superfamily phosphatase
MFKNINELTPYETLYNKAAKVHCYPITNNNNGYTYQAVYHKLVHNYKRKPTVKQLATLFDLAN